MAHVCLTRLLWRCRLQVALLEGVGSLVGELRDVLRCSPAGDARDYYDINSGSGSGRNISGSSCSISRWY